VGRFDAPATTWHNVRRLAPKLGTVVEEASLDRILGYHVHYP